VPVLQEAALEVVVLIRVLIMLIGKAASGKNQTTQRKTPVEAKVDVPFKREVLAIEAAQVTGVVAATLMRSVLTVDSVELAVGAVVAAASMVVKVVVAALQQKRGARRTLKILIFETFCPVENLILVLEG
jgi:hypothetical protein